MSLAPTDEPVSLRVVNLRWPVRDSLERFSGELAFDVPATSFELDPSFTAQSLGNLSPVPGGVRPAVHVDEGTAEFSDLLLPLAGGSILVGGTLALAEDVYDLRVRVDRAGVPSEPIHLVGRRGELRPATFPVPDPPEPPKER